MQKWEYSLMSPGAEGWQVWNFTTNQRTDYSDVDIAFRTLGQEGWDLTGTLPNVSSNQGPPLIQIWSAFNFYFKRPIL